MVNGTFGEHLRDHGRVSGLRLRISLPIGRHKLAAQEKNYRVDEIDYSGIPDTCDWDHVPEM